MTIMLVELVGKSYKVFRVRKVYLLRGSHVRVSEVRASALSLFRVSGLKTKPETRNFFSFK